MVSLKFDLSTGWRFLIYFPGSASSLCSSCPKSSLWQLTTDMQTLHQTNRKNGGVAKELWGSELKKNRYFKDWCVLKIAVSQNLPISRSWMLFSVEVAMIDESDPQEPMEPQVESPWGKTIFSISAYLSFRGGRGKVVDNRQCQHIPPINQ